MSKILKNQTASAVSIDDVGQLVPASGQLTIQATDELLFKGSDDVITLIGNGTLVLNDGTNDLSISDAIDMIKGVFPSDIEISIDKSIGPDLPVTLRRSDINEIKEEFTAMKELLFQLANNTMEIKDGQGSGKSARVNDFNALKVIDQRLPPADDPVTVLPVKLDFTDSAGATDMRVDGSTTNVDFTIEADPNYDIFIDSVSFLIADVNAVANKFGNTTELTNGCSLFYEDLDNGVSIINDSLKTNFDFIRMCQGKPSFGNSNDALKVTNAAGAAEGYMPVLDFSEMFGLPWGIRLRAGSNEKIVIRVRDNVTGVDAFDAIAFGFKKVR